MKKTRLVILAMLNGSQMMQADTIGIEWNVETNKDGYNLTAWRDGSKFIDEQFADVATLQNYCKNENIDFDNFMVYDAENDELKDWE